MVSLLLFWNAQQNPRLNQSIEFKCKDTNQGYIRFFSMMLALVANFDRCTIQNELSIFPGETIFLFFRQLSISMNMCVYFFFFILLYLVCQLGCVCRVYFGQKIKYFNSLSSWTRNATRQINSTASKISINNICLSLAVNTKQQ